MQLNEFENYLKIHVDSFNSRKTYLRRIKVFFKDYKEFNQENINSYLAQVVDKKLSKSLFNVSISAFKHYAKFKNLDITFPKQKWIGKNIRPYVTETELKEKIFPYFKYLFPNPEYYQFIILFLFYTGLRPNELINLKTDDICLDEPMIIIRNPKDKDDRYAPYPRVFQSQIQKFMNKSGKAFKISYQQIQLMFTRINKQLNYPKHLTAYSLRHGFAKYMLKQGYSINEIQQYMGHSDIKMTSIYTNITPKEAIDRWIEREKKKKRK